MTRAWTTGATWNSSDGTTAWTTPGGDYSTPAAATVSSVGGVAGWQHWYPTDLVQRWSLSVGTDVRLQRFGDGSVDVRGPDNAQWLFTSTPDGRFTSPPGIDATLVKNQDGSYTLTAHASGMTDSFDSSGTLVAEADRAGNTLRFSYTGGLLTSITDTQGRTTTVTSNAANAITQITDPANRTTSYGYTGGNTLVSSTDPAGKVTTYAYDSTGHLSQITDPDGNVTTITYDASTRVTAIGRVTNPATGAGYTWRFSYIVNGCVVTDPNNHATTYAGDPYGRITAITYPDNTTSHQSWTSNNDIAQETAPSGAVTSYSYDSLHNLTGVTLPTGPSFSWQYANPGFPYLPSSFTDEEGRTTSYGYNSQGLVTSITDSAGHASSAVYNANGTPSSETDANGHTTSYSYVAGGQSVGLLSQIVHPSPLGSESFTYTDANLPATSTDGKGQTTSYSYDPLDRTTSVGYADTSSVGYVYDADGNLLSQADSTGTTTYTYNALGQLTQEIQPGNKTISYTYDSVDNLLSKADAGGTVSYGYTVNDELASVTEPSGTRTTVAYDQDGNRTSVAYPNGVTQTMSYDPSSQLTQIASRNSANTTLTSFAYNYTNPTTARATTSRYSMTDMAGAVTSYTYDSLSRLTGAVQKTAGGAQLASYSYAYDNGGNMTSQTLNGATTAMSYNAADQLTGAGGRTFAYDANGNQTSLANSYTPSAQVVSNGGFESGQSPWQTSPAFSPVTAAYAHGGTASADLKTYAGSSQQLSQTVTLPPQTTNVTFSYWLYYTTSSGTGSCAPFHVSIQTSGGGTIYTVPTPCPALANRGWQQVSVDVSSFLAGYSGQQVQVVFAVDCSTTASSDYYLDDVSLVTGGMTTASYNAKDQTGSMTPYGGTAVGMGYRGEGQSERISVGGTTWQYDQTGIGAMTSGSGTTYFTNGPDGELISERTPTGTYYYLYDGLGSVVGLTDSSGTVVNRYSYDPYGNTTSVSETVANPFRYIGAIWDSQTGLYKMGERFYDPSIARFTQTDPLGGGYSYTDGNPINYVDPSGLCGIDEQVDQCPNGEVGAAENGLGGTEGDTQAWEHPEQDWISPQWGRNRLVKEMHKRGWRLQGQTRKSSGLMYHNPKTGEKIRIMKRPNRRPFRNEPRAKFANSHYYRYMAPGHGWGPHTTIPD